MASQITALDPVTTPLNTRTILAKEGYTCTLLTLAPGEETALRATNQSEDHLLFVIEGSVTLRAGEVNTILGKDQAVPLRKGDETVVVAQPDGWTKLLRIDIPPRQIVTPQIITFDR